MHPPSAFSVKEAGQRVFRTSSVSLVTAADEAAQPPITMADPSAIRSTERKRVDKRAVSVGIIECPKVSGCEANDASIWRLLFIADRLSRTRYLGSDNGDQLRRFSTRLVPQFYSRSVTQPLWLRGVHGPLGVMIVEFERHQCAIRLGLQEYESCERVLRAFGWQCRDVSDHIVEVILIG